MCIIEWAPWRMNSLSSLLYTRARLERSGERGLSRGILGEAQITLSLEVTSEVTVLFRC